MTSSASSPLPRVVVIGGGIAGLGTACLLARAGHPVRLFEKNEQLGGRASVYEAEGFRFDMGPSWYLMPDVFAHFFALMGERVDDRLDLRKLAPSYRIFFKGTPVVQDFFSDVERDRAVFEAWEPGAAQALDRYLLQAKEAYEISRQWFLYRNYDSVLDFFDRRALVEGRRLSVFSNLHRHVARFFSDERLRKVVEYQLVFLGSSPYRTPALYSLMSHIDFEMGVFYPQGGFGSVVGALEGLARAHGVEIALDSPVHRILVEDGKAAGVLLGDGTRIDAEIVVSNADYVFTEQILLDAEHRSFSKRYWEARALAPSAFILYLGVKGELPQLTHHNLIFSEDWRRNFAEIFDDPRWPSDPSLYVCKPSATDPTVAPPGHENLFVLVPIPAGLEYTPADLAWYEEKILKIVSETMAIPDLAERIVYRRPFSTRDFEERYNAYRGTALGFAHTLFQTAAFRPNNVSKKVKNLYYAGAGTNPGIGMPACLISAELAYKRIKGIKSAGALEEAGPIPGNGE